MRGGQPARGGQAEGHRARSRDAARAGDSASQCSPGQQLHDEQADALVFDIVVHGHHVRMIEGGKEPGLLGEAAPDRGIVPETRRELLDRDPAVELPVLARDHHAHAALTQLFTDVVGGQRIAE